MNPITPKCLATGVGSLPLKDAAPALNMVLENLSDIPHWPQLALPGEQLVGQYLNPLIKLGLVIQPTQGVPYFDKDQPDWLDKQTEFYSYFLEKEETGVVPEVFGFPPEAAVGFYSFLELMNKNKGAATFIKGQVTGPVTVGMQLIDTQKRPSYYDPELRDLLVKTLGLHAAWQGQKLKQFGLPAIIVIDEPTLYGYGASTHVTLKREEIIEEINHLIDELHNQDVYAGIHVCANTDWGMVLDTKLDVLSFDAYQFFQSVALYPQELKAFIDRGGVLAWGIVPTSDAALKEDVQSLKELFYQQVEVLVIKGMDRDKIVNQSIITPSCGVGSLPLDLANRIYQLTGQLSQELRK